ncbi:head GIN domain-containing protein [Mucilaginibacter koreensis]
MKSLSKILLAAALLSGAGAVQTVNAATFTTTSAFDTQDRHLSGFNAIDATGSFDVIITQGNTESVKVEAPADVIDRITTEVKGGVLKLGTKRNNGWNWNWNDNKRIVIYVSIREVNAVNLSGSGDVMFKNGLRAENLRVTLSGSGDISGRVEAKTLESRISGSGDLKLSGRASYSSISISGSGDYSAESLACEEVAVRISGSGDVHVNANSKIDSSISGSGDVYYSGNAKQISTSKTGSGEVHHI